MKPPAIVAALVAATVAVHAQPPTLDVVLARAASYVSDFHRQLSSIVAEERYVQEVKRFGRGPGRLVESMHLDLRSDLLLVRAGRPAAWVQYRDVFEVDGNAVADRQERLASLLSNGMPSDERMRRILEENSRYNIGDILRNVNVPLLALQCLEPANQWRFRFRRTSDRSPSAAPPAASAAGAFHVSIEMWTIQFEEKERPTIIRTPSRKDVPTQGRFWIDPDNGRVLMTELIAQNRDVRATIDVSYQSEPLAGLLVPVEMRERYEGRRDDSLIEAHATYGRFRRIPAAPEPFLDKK